MPIMPKDKYELAFWERVYASVSSNPRCISSTVATEWTDHALSEYRKRNACIFPSPPDPRPAARRPRPTIENAFAIPNKEQLK